MDGLLVSTTKELGFEGSYVAVRSKEQRIYTDAEVAALPEIHAGHVHYNEWLQRKRSATRLKNYLKSKNKPLKILEVGCGNGWLSAMLADIPDSEVTGIDCNLIEIEQACRVFNKENLNFLYRSFQDGFYTASGFDCIVFAASVQYFPSFQNLMDKALGLLNNEGEIHILDSHFYKQEEIGDAFRRTENYYTNIGFPEMATYYFHHQKSGLDEYKHRILFNPQAVLNKLFASKQSFYWISITGGK